MARQQARRRNRERLAGVALAALGVVVLAVAIFAIRNPRGSTPAAQDPSSSSPVSSSSSSSSASRHSSGPGSGTPSAVNSDSSSAPSGQLTLAQAQQVPLVVLNNSTVTGLAAQAAQRFESAGWTVTSYGNLTNDIISTCAYYDPNQPNAEAAARALKHEFPTIRRVRPKFPQLPGGPVVVVLTGDYSPQ